MSNATSLAVDFISLIDSGSKEALILGAVATGLGGVSFIYLMLKTAAAKYLLSKIPCLAPAIDAAGSKLDKVLSKLESDVEKQVVSFKEPEPDLSKV